jgi:SAM-dependent methyltransferase
MIEANREASRQPDSGLSTAAWDRYGAACEARWLAARGGGLYRSAFLRDGYCLIPLPGAIATALRRFFDPALATPLRESDHRADYHRTPMNRATVRRLNAQMRYYARPAPEVTAPLEEFLAAEAAGIEAQLGHAWRVGNVRAFALKPGGDTGGSTWHFDGFSRYQRKLMFYLDPPGRETGSVALATRAGEIRMIASNGPIALLFDAAILCHRGLPPVSGERPAIEVAILPADRTDPTLVFAGQNARTPIHCDDAIERQLAAERWRPEIHGRPRKKKLGLRILGKKVTGLRKAVVKALRGERASRPLPELRNMAWRLNIGGGRKFNHRGWINLEGVPNPNNPFPFALTPDCIFPAASGSIGIVYSSHCLEHLDDATVARALAEARRVIADDGRLVIKLPDFDAVLAAWKGRDRAVFFDRKWGLQDIVHSWPARGVADDLDARAAYTFCGFWNAAWGEHFTDAPQARNVSAYNGPPVQIAQIAPELTRLSSPHEVARRLREAVLQSERDFHFNHQNGWSRMEFCRLLEASGFSVVSMDAAAVRDRNGDIPGIESDFEISAYFEARPS